MDASTSSIIAASLGAIGVLAGAMLASRARRARSDARKLAESMARERDLPRSLHPVIDPDICIGSLSCLKSCPEGDILGVVDGAARLIHGDHCIGHGRCAAECPVGAIQLVFGTAKRGIDLPEVDEFFESSRPGVHVIGELAGMGLIRNAMIQGLECVEHIAGELSGAPAPTPGTTDVAIVGAGPAGLAAALAARKAGIAYRLVDQGPLGGAVVHFPRQKLVMSETVDLPLHGRFGKRRMSKEDLLAAFQAIAARNELRVEEGITVTGIAGEDGTFEVQTDRGPIATRKVVLAVGRRGTPRKLGVTGEEREKVTYALADPEQYRGKHVLVVGGGDSALEAALQLEAGGARVTVSYRGSELGRCRQETRSKIESLATASSLRLVLSSHVRSIGADHVALDVAGREVRLQNDYVVVNIGGELPLDLLRNSGVALRRYHGEAPAARHPGKQAAHDLLRKTGPGVHERRREHAATAVLVLVGAAILGLLAWKGRDYYPLPPRTRMLSPLHRSMRSAGSWGHGVGIAATAFMLSNFLYAARKHFRFMTGWGRIRSWLKFHVFVGFMSPLVIAFHAAFQSRNLLATGTASALAVVVVTGIVGRYVYALVPAAGEKVVEVADLQARFVRLGDALDPILATASDPTRLRRLFQRATSPITAGSLAGLLVRWLFRSARARADLLRVRPLFSSRADFSDFREGLLRMQRLAVQIRFYRSLRSFLGAWRVLHASLATFLVLVIAAHIAVSLYLGYGLFRWR